MSEQTPAWDTENLRNDRINDLVYELGLVDHGVSDEDIVLGAMATNAMVRHMITSMISAEVFTDADNRQVFTHLCGGDEGHQQMSNMARGKLEFFELGAIHVGAIDAMRTARSLLETHLHQRLSELADTAQQAPPMPVAEQVLSPPLHYPATAALSPSLR